MLTVDRLKQLVEYNPETGVFLRRHITRGAHPVAGNLRLDGYVSLFLDGKARLAHRMAWLYVQGVLPPSQLDHINGDRTDNRVANLRPATRSENAQNIGRPYSNNKGSGVLGVYPHERGKWQARIQVNGKARSLGLFADIASASAAYKAAKAELHPFAARL